MRKTGSASRSAIAASLYCEICSPPSRKLVIWRRGNAAGRVAVCQRRVIAHDKLAAACARGDGQHGEVPRHRSLNAGYRTLGAFPPQVWVLHPRKPPRDPGRAAGPCLRRRRGRSMLGEYADAALRGRCDLLIRHSTASGRGGKCSRRWPERGTLHQAGLSLLGQPLHGLLAHAAVLLLDLAPLAPRPLSRFGVVEEATRPLPQHARQRHRGRHVARGQQRLLQRIVSPRPRVAIIVRGAGARG